MIESILGRSDKVMCNMRARGLLSGLAIGFLLFAGIVASGIVTVPANAALTPVWQAQADMPTPKAQAEIAAGLDGMVYVFGGVKAIDSVSHEYQVTVDESFVFDPATGSWSAIANMPYGARAGVAIAGDDGLIYVFGGYNDTWGSLSYAQIYDPVANSWTLGTGMTYQEGFLSGAKGYDGRMYIFGGSDAVGRVQIYDPVGDSWSLGTNMPSPMFSGTCVAVTGTTSIYYLGGTDSFSTSSTTCVAYDAYSDSWSYLTSLPAARAGGSAVIAADGLVYFMGGGNTAYNTGGLVGGQEFYSTTLVYSRFNDTWFSAVDLSYAARYGMSVASAEGNVWFFGGNNNTVVYSNVSMLEVMSITISLSSNTVTQGESVLMYVNPQFAYQSVRFYYMSVYLETPTGFAYDSISVGTSTDIPFVVEIPVPEAAETGVNTIVMSNFAFYTLDWTSIELPLTDTALTVEAMVPIEDLIAGLEAQLTTLQANVDSLAAQLNAADANASALRTQVAALQTQLTDLQNIVNANNASQSAQMNAMLADLQEQITAMQDQLDKVKTTSDSGSMWGMVNLVLIIVVIVLLLLMLMMSRKKT